MISISRFSEHQRTKSSSRRVGDNTDQEQSGREATVREVLPVQKAPRRWLGIGTTTSAMRTLSRGAEAAREGTPQNVKFEYSVSNC